MGGGGERSETFFRKRVPAFRDPRKEGSKGHIPVLHNRKGRTGEKDSNILEFINDSRRGTPVENWTKYLPEEPGGHSDKEKLGQRGKTFLTKARTTGPTRYSRL